MSSNYILPLKAPAPLPASGVDSVTFKVWKNTLVSHIQQDVNHFLFMPDGIYSTWRASENGTRIRAILDTDPDKETLDGKLNQNQLTAAAHRTAVTQLLNKRNAQLSKFITHIASLCHYTENDDVTNGSTSLNWIFSYLKKHYGLETKGANFMNISDHAFKQGTPFQTFYKQYRASFIDNLRKRGDRILYKNNQELTEDEVLTSSFENAIVLWSLEKIDPRLPKKVKKDYGHQMTGDTTLKDLQPVIFDNIPNMLEDLEQTQIAKAFATSTLTDDEATINAISTRSKDKFRQSRPFTQYQRRGSTRPPFPNKGTPGKAVVRGSSSQDVKFCRICSLAGSDPRVFNSHEIGNCTRLTMRDLDSLRQSLVLNGIITEEDEPEQPIYSLQPGWDDKEAAQIQSPSDSD